LETQVQELKVLNRSRNLSFWHDASTVSNHSHILMMVTCLYDKAIFYNDAEYHEISGMHIARCPSNDKQLMYVDTRFEDIQELTTPLQWNGVPIFDKMKLFSGDGPAAQFEAGHQKGGDYFCWGCVVVASQVNNIAFALNQPYISYSALLFNTPDISLKEANLDCYDILLCEPLHDVSGHIKNLFVELPLHMDKEHRKLFKDSVQAAFGGKDSKRGCDYRLALVLLTKLFQSHLESIADFLLIVPPIWEVSCFL